MNFIGTKVNVTSSRTGLRISHDFMIASCFQSTYDFQKFLATMYVKDIDYYFIYSKLLSMYLNANPDNLSQMEILENKTILSTIEAMFDVRDKQEYDLEKQQQDEFQAFMNSITKSSNNR